MRLLIPIKYWFSRKHRLEAKRERAMETLGLDEYDLDIICRTRIADLRGIDPIQKFGRDIASLTQEGITALGGTQTLLKVPAKELLKRIRHLVNVRRIDNLSLKKLYALLSSYAIASNASFPYALRLPQ